MLVKQERIDETDLNSNLSQRSLSLILRLGLY